MCQPFILKLKSVTGWPEIEKKTRINQSNRITSNIRKTSSLFLFFFCSPNYWDKEQYIFHQVWYAKTIGNKDQTFISNTEQPVLVLFVQQWEVQLSITRKRLIKTFVFAVNHSSNRRRKINPRCDQHTGHFY